MLYGLSMVGLFTTVSLVTYIATDAAVLEYPSPIVIRKNREKIREYVEEKEKDITANPPAKDPTHHIVAKYDYRAEESRKILRGVGIEPITDPLNLVVLPKNYHVSIHTAAYHNYVTERLRPVAGDREGVKRVLKELKAEILEKSIIGIRWE